MIGRSVTLAQLKQHLKQLAPTRTIDSVIVHHFYRPTASEWQGLQTLEAVWRFHVETNGWADIGYHVVVGPDDTIWLARPSEEVGAHCKEQNDTSIGIAFAADFDTVEPVANGLATGWKVVAAICERFSIPAERVFFHRDFSPKSCPGTRMDRKAFRREVEQVLTTRGR
jgi:N-acetyl-anhydromuramyl-L-alanine amidase AmpD